MKGVLAWIRFQRVDAENSFRVTLGAAAGHARAITTMAALEVVKVVLKQRVDSLIEL
jgi:hypothetical protein